MLEREGAVRGARVLPVLLDVSLSKARKLRSCPRSVYWEVAGPRHPDPATAALVRRLKALTGLEAALGIALHEVARQIATALRDGHRPPRFEEGLAYLRAQLNTLWTATREQHDRAPERGGCLRERWYGEAIPEETLVRVRTRLHSQYRRLYHHPAWETVRQAGRGDVVVCDTLDYLPVHLDGLPAARLYAAPDLCLMIHGRIELPNYGIPAPGPTALLIDWKSGRFDPLRRDDALDQLAVYAGWCNEKLHLPMGALGYVGRVADLSAPDHEGEDTWALLGPREIARGRAVIRRTLEELAGYVDESGRWVKARMPADVSACARCNYAEVCHPDLARLDAEA